MSKLEIAKEIVKKYYKHSYYDLYDSNNTCNDKMSILYHKNGLTIKICYDYCYFQVFGLDKNELDELRLYCCLLFYNKI